MIVLPDIFNDDTKVTLLFNVVNPETFNVETNVVLLYNVVNPLTFNIFDNIESPLTFNANIPGVVTFIPRPEEVIICLSTPFILYFASREDITHAVTL